MPFNHDLFVPPFRHDEFSYDEYHVCMNVGWSPAELQIASGSEKFDGPIYRGGFLVTPAGHPVRWNLRDKADALSIRIKPDIVYKVAASMDLNPDKVDIVPTFNSYDRVVRLTGGRLLEELNSENIRGPLFAESKAYELSADLLCGFSNKLITNTDKFVRLIDKKIQDVREYLKDEYQSNLSVEQMANIAGVSPAYFARSFKKSTGIPPHKFLTNLKMEEATRVLSFDRRVTIKEISNKLGYEDIQYFYRVFKREVVCTPDQYRYKIR